MNKSYPEIVTRFMFEAQRPAFVILIDADQNVSCTLTTTKKRISSEDRERGGLKSIDTYEQNRTRPFC